MLIGLQGPEHETDSLTFSVAISACAKGQQPVRAHDLLAIIRGLGHELDVNTYNAAISVRVKGLQPERALAKPTVIPPSWHALRCMRCHPPF